HHALFGEGSSPQVEECCGAFGCTGGFRRAREAAGGTKETAGRVHRGRGRAARAGRLGSRTSIANAAAWGCNGGANRTGAAIARDSPAANGGGGGDAPPPADDSAADSRRGGAAAPATDDSATNSCSGVAAAPVAANSRRHQRLAACGCSSNVAA